MSDRDALKTRAADLEIEFQPRIPTDQLQALVDAKEAEMNKGDTPAQDTPQSDEGKGGGEDAPTTPTVPAGAVLRVTGPKKGRWRAGRHFTAEAVEIPLDDLTEDEIAALMDDPKLIAAIIDADE